MMKVAKGRNTYEKGAVVAIGTDTVKILKDLPPYHDYTILKCGNEVLIASRLDMLEEYGQEKGLEVYKKNGCTFFDDESYPLVANLSDKKIGYDKMLIRKIQMEGNEEFLSSTVNTVDRFKYVGTVTPALLKLDLKVGIYEQKDLDFLWCEALKERLGIDLSK